jgi:hypothetical protein
MPAVPADVVDGEALAFVTVRGFIDLMQDTPVEHQFDPGVRDYNARPIRIDHIPVPAPEVELPVSIRCTRYGATDRPGTGEPENCRGAHQEGWADGELATFQ